MIESTGLILERGAPAYAPNFPYAASKAASIIWRAYHYTYGPCTTTTNCFNNYDPHHFPGDADPAHDRHLVLSRGWVGEVYNVGGGRPRPV